MDFSFYGGRPAKPFIISAVYPSVIALEEAFQTHEIDFGEYALVNTQNAVRDLDNGKLFYKDRDKSAHYVGKIVGPPGYAPNMKLVSYDEIEDPQDSTEDKLITQYIFKVDNGLESGKNTDTIQAKLLSERVYNSEDEIDETTVSLGLKIPYFVLELEGDSVNAYENASIEEIEKRPFFSKFKAHLPKGIKGNSIENINIATISEDSVIENLPDNKENLFEKKVLTTQIRNYNDSAEGDVSNPYFVGYFNDISDAEVTSKGQLKISYSGDKPSQIVGSVITNQDLYIYRVIRLDQVEEGIYMTNGADNGPNPLGYLNDKFKDGVDSETEADISGHVINIQWPSSMEGEGDLFSHFYSYCYKNFGEDEASRQWMDIGSFSVNPIVIAPEHNSSALFFKTKKAPERSPEVVNALSYFATLLANPAMVEAEIGLLDENVLKED